MNDSATNSRYINYFVEMQDLNTNVKCGPGGFSVPLRTLT